jgi:hypothetical protein
MRYFLCEQPCRPKSMRAPRSSQAGSPWASRAAEGFRPRAREKARVGDGRAADLVNARSDSAIAGSVPERLTGSFREREGHRIMRELKGIPRQGPEKRTRSPFDGYSSRMGWDVAILLIFGTSLALATLAWLLVGSLMNEQQSATPRPKPNEGLELRLQNTKLGR